MTARQTPTQLDQLLADHESPVERARNALPRVFMDQTPVRMFDDDTFDDDDSSGRCTNPSGHEWSEPSEEYDRIYCIWCGADGDG